MPDAQNTPIQRPKREASTADMPLPQRPAVDLPEEGAFERPDNTLELADATALHGSYAEQLAFNEEPITILIHPSREKNPPLVVDCWVNGKGAEVFVAGKWHEFNCLPVNKPVTTKRKYAEVLAMSRTETINTHSDDATVEHPVNRIQRMTSANVMFSVLNDANPKGHEWLRRVMAQAL